MKWEQMANEIGRKVFQAEMADGMVPVNESGERWDRYFESVKGKSHTWQLPDYILRHVGQALIVMEKQGMVKFE